LRHSTPRYCFSLAPGPSEFDETKIVGLDPDGEDGEIRKTGVFYERSPYENVGISPNLRDSNKYTRFISLARFGNEKKKRWFMALNLVGADQLGEKPLVKVNGATLSPFAMKSVTSGDGRGVKREGEGGDGLESGPNFRWSAGNGKKRVKRGEFQITSLCREVPLLSNLIRSEHFLFSFPIFSRRRQRWTSTSRIRL